MGIFCSFPHAHCARQSVRNLNQTIAGVFSGEDHGTEGQEEGRGQGSAEQQFAWNLILTKRSVLWRRYCTFHSVQLKGGVQRLNNLAMRQVKKVRQVGRNAYT